MTAIAAFSLNGLPIVVGDLLLSGPERHGQRLEIPTVGPVDSVFPGGSGYTIVGLRQKVVVVSPELTIAWSGTQIVAAAVLNDLAKRVEERGATPDIVEEFFAEVSVETYSRDVAFVGVVMSKKGPITFNYNATIVEIESFGRVHLAGSGSRSLKEKLARTPLEYRVPQGVVKTGNEALARAIIVAGLLLEQEIDSHRSLYSYYGGGYEFATLIDGRFQKVDDVMYVFWYAKIDDAGAWLRKPDLYLKYQYRPGNVLAIRSVREVDSNEEMVQIIDDSINWIRPILGNIERADLDVSHPPDMSARFVCNIVLLRKPTGEQEVLCRFDFDPGRRLVTMEESGDRRSFNLDREYVCKLYQMLASRQRNALPAGSGKFGRFFPESLAGPG